MEKINGEELISLIKLTSNKKIGILDNKTIIFLLFMFINMVKLISDIKYM